MKTIALILMFTTSALPGFAADGYPSRPIRFIVPYAAGGNADIMGRLIGQRLADALAQSVIIDNRPGASSIIGSEIVARAAPDGHTLLFIANSHASNPAINKNLPYDTLKDFAPISLTGSTPMALVATNNLSADTLKHFIALAKTRPGQINYATASIGGPGHLAGVLLGMMADFNFTHVPYKATSQATTDVIAGHIQSALPSLTSVLPHVRAGRLKALGITSAKRSLLAPEIPTIAESGVPGYEALIWNGLIAPGATPKNVIARLNQEILRIINTPETRVRYTALGADALTSTPREFDAFIRTEMMKWEKVIKTPGFRVE